MKNARYELQFIRFETTNQRYFKGSRLDKEANFKRKARNGRENHLTPTTSNLNQFGTEIEKGHVDKEREMNMPHSHDSCRKCHAKWKKCTVRILSAYWGLEKEGHTPYLWPKLKFSTIFVLIHKKEKKNVADHVLQTMRRYFIQKTKNGKYIQNARWQYFYKTW